MALKMKLVMFDVDGTLARTFQVDAKHYGAALARLVPVQNFSMDWSVYPHVTDSSILHHHFMTSHGRAPQSAEVASFQEFFTRSLADAFASAPDHFQAVPGAGKLLQHLRESTEYAVAIASGGWRQSALFKLRAAGLPIEGLPAAFADDGHAREDIMRTACRRAAEHYGCANFDAIVYVGDGLHDVRASQNLSYGFIGVAGTERAERLRAAGARHIVADFTDTDAFLRLLMEAGLQGRQNS
jgi:phosphoglycolate phosphatase-like HAD superfamily hydrolase